jgi:arabinan endo-1,5-alpha-L-arabinosidase
MELKRGIGVVLFGLFLAGLGVAQTPSTEPTVAPGAGPQAGPGVPPRVGGGGQGGARFMAPVGVPVLGMPFVHDPSTVVRSKGKYYVYATGRGIPFYSSPDGETWTREGSVFEKIPDDVHAAVPKNDGTGVWAPDIVRVGDQFYLYYAVSFWGSFQSAVALVTSPTLDPKDPAYKWTDRGVVVSSDGVEDLNAIDPGVMQAPDGTLWLCYGSYHGTIDLVQLDPKTGLRMKGKPVTVIANRSEAADLIFHDGYYYLFVNHDSCCKGRNSEYNIRVGRSKSVTGPYLDKHGDPLTKGAGSVFLAAHDHRIGPGHFGRVLDYDAAADGMERFSVHYEADTTRGGRSVLDIRPLLWSADGWPVAGDNLADGTYQMVSRQSEYTLEEHIPGAPAPAAVTPPRVDPAFPATQKEPTGPPSLRVTRYLTLENQKWTIVPVAGRFYKLVNAATGDALGIAEGGSVGLGAYTGADGQMWNLEEFPDGGYRIGNKASGMSLAASGGGGIAVSAFVRDDAHLWTIMTP